MYFPQPISIKRRMQYDLDTICDPLRSAKPISHPQHQIKRKAKDKATRFSQDERLDDVNRMLSYTHTLLTKLPASADSS